MMSETYSKLVMNILSELNSQFNASSNSIDIVRRHYDTWEKDEFIYQKNSKFLSIKDSSTYFHYESTENNSLDSFVNDIYVSAKRSIADSAVSKDLTPFYFPELKDEVISLFCQYPIWTSLECRLNIEDSTLFADCALDFKNDCSNLIDDGPQNVAKVFVNHVDVICSDEQQKLLNINTN